MCWVKRTEAYVMLTMVADGCCCSHHVNRTTYLTCCLATLLPPAMCCAPKNTRRCHRLLLLLLLQQPSPSQAVPAGQQASPRLEAAVKGPTADGATDSLPSAPTVGVTPPASGGATSLSPAECCAMRAVSGAC